MKPSEEEIYCRVSKEKQWTKNCHLSEKKKKVKIETWVAQPYYANA